MARSWYVANRPQLVDEIDEEKVRAAILSFVKNGKFPHALLFAGPKGTGKTSTARIVAKILNCEKTTDKLGEPCNKCAQCVEITNGNSMCVVEVDAASHRGIDDIRALRETVRLMPAGGRTKVYIIDEAHMLTTEAANALLKTLEEPPENVVFILATTDAQKIPDTIKSRTTLVQFGRAAKIELERSLNRVIKKEKIDVEEGALDILINNNDGSFRDATKILEQIATDGKITKESVESFFVASVVNPVSFLNLLAQKDSKEILTEVENLVNKGVNPRQFTTQLIETLHQSLLNKVGVGKTETELPFQLNEIKILIGLLSQAVEEMKTAPIAELPLELAMIEWVGGKLEGSQSTRLSRNSVPTEGGTTSRGFRAQSSDYNPLEVTSNIRDVHSSTDSPSTDIGNDDQRVTTNLAPLSEDMWKQLLNKVKSQNFSLEALLRSARPLSFDGRDVTLSVFYKFHKDKLEEESHRRVLEQILCDLLGAQNVRLFFVLGEKPKTVIADDSIIISDDKPIAESEDITKMAEEIFGVEVHD